jgi:hypothetical protein
MTIEELQEALSAATSALEKANTSITKLERKNEEIIGKLQAADARAEEAEEQAKAPSTDLDKAVKRAEKAEKELLASNERATQLETTRRNERADALIAKALNSANVDSKHTSILSKALRGDVQFSDDGDPLLEGKSVDDFAKSYFAPKGEGHWMVRAANNSGGAATGHDGTKPPRMTKETWNATEFAMIQKENPAEANAIADAVGRPTLKIPL